MNLDFVKVCGKHNAIYEAYYKQIDPKGSGAIEAMTAAKFLKKSGLSDVVLSRIWDLSDPNGKGFLDKPGFFVSLKLVSLAQAGQVINMSNIYTETANPPKVGELPKNMPPRIQTVPTTSAAGGDWSIKVIDRLKYEQLFESLKPTGGMLAGNKVKGVLMDSKLPMDVLGKIWDLADQDKDGNLDKHEFIVAMHLVYQTLDKRTVPDVLPPELRKTVGGGPPPKPAPPVIAHLNGSAANSMPRAPSGENLTDGGFVADFPKDIAPPVMPPLPPAVPPIQRIPTVPPSLMSTDPLIPIGAPPSVTASADWVVTPAELKRYEVIFRDSDRDKDGLVSGLEVKNVFLQSGVPQNCLAHIWALCDTNQSGKLTLEQFALAMWMVERKQRGVEPPQVLTSNMVPPSMRGIVAGVDLLPQEPKPTYSNPELEMISKEIEELAKERRALETEIAQKEADIRIKSGEVRSLQSELDTLSATLKQLEHQRGEAQKRLDELQLQSTDYQEALQNTNLEISQKRVQVAKIREQCQKQEETINEQEGELNAKRSEMQKLKDEEIALQKEYDENNKELQNLTQHLQNTQLQISSVRSMVTQLLETQRQMTDALLMCRAAIESNDGELVTEYQLKIEPDFDEARKTLEKKIEIAKSDPFEETESNVITDKNSLTTNGFANDPFSANTTNTTLRTVSGFDDSFNSGFDDFSQHSGGFGQSKDPFGNDSYADSAKSDAITNEPGRDDFGSDPFAALHAPTGQGQVLNPNAQKSGPPPRPESPSPALPPKKSKVPPPRPAPPRPLQAPSRPPQPPMDSFGANVNTNSGFADFADFDNKQSSIIPPSPSPLPIAITSSTSSFTPTQYQTFASTSGYKNSPLTPSASSLVVSLPSLLTSSSLTTATASITKSKQSTATPTTTTTFNLGKNHLNCSNKSLQQAASFTGTAATGEKLGMITKSSVSVPSPSPALPVIYGPTDFADDPFKDYRYEDPFNIKDPFADDNSTGDENIFKDDLSSEDDNNNNNNNLVNEQRNTYHSDFDHVSDFTNTSKISNSTCSTAQTFKSAKSVTPLNNEFIGNFDTLNLNPSPALSAKSGSTECPVIQATAGSVKSQRASPFDNFANFDAFSTKSTKSSNNSSLEISNSNAINTNNNNNNNNKIKSSSNELISDLSNDSFFDAFNDNFLNNTKKNTNRKTKTNENIFDAFGVETTTTSSNSNTSDTTNKSPTADTFNNTFDAFATKSTKVFDDDFTDVNAFEDDFFKEKTALKHKFVDANLNINKKDIDKPIPTAITNNFAKLNTLNDDAFAPTTTVKTTSLNNSVNYDVGAFAAFDNEKLNKVQNNTMPPSKMPNSAIGTKLPSKFAADYSNSESFHDDLEEVIKRSMVEK